MIDKALVMKAKRGKGKLSKAKLREVMKARAEVVEGIHRLVHKIAQRYRKKIIYMTYDELIQEGMCGVMIAIEKFQVKFKTQFVTYATWWIRQSMQRAMMVKNQSLVRRKCMDGTFSKFEAFYEDELMAKEDHQTPELRITLDEAFSCLCKRDAKILKLRFYEHLTLEETTKKIGVTRERVRQIEFRALKRLYRYFGEKGMKFFEDC